MGAISSLEEKYCLSQSMFSPLIYCKEKPFNYSSGLWVLVNNVNFFSSQEIILLAFLCTAFLSETFCFPRDIDENPTDPSKSSGLLIPISGFSRSKRHPHSTCVKQIYYDIRTQRRFVKCKRGSQDCFEVAFGRTGICESVKDSDDYVISCRCKGT